MKPKLSIDEQIEHLKSKGIKFNKINETQAKDILTKNTYYFKLKIYTKNYNKSANNLYENIEFAYLYDMSKLDLRFRNFILKLTLNIEHLTKTKLLADFNASNEDGYEIVAHFLNTNAKAKSYIELLQKQGGKGGSYDIVSHYQGRLPIWALVEILQFNDLLGIIRLFYQRHSTALVNQSLNAYLMSLNSVKWLRNLSAHNNCILIKLNNYNGEIRKHLFRKISAYRLNIEPANKSYNIEKMLKNSTIEAFLETWLFFMKICSSDTMKKHCISELNEVLSYSKQESKVECRKSSQDIDNFFTFIEKTCKILEF